MEDGLSKHVDDASLLLPSRQQRPLYIPLDRAYLPLDGSYRRGRYRARFGPLASVYLMLLHEICDMRYETDGQLKGSSRTRLAIEIYSPT